MRRAIEDLRSFYGEPTGALVRRLLAKRLEDAWGEAPGCDVRSGAFFCVFRAPPGG